MLVLKKGKIIYINGLTIVTGDVMNRIDEKRYKYLWISEMDNVFEEEITEEFNVFMFTCFSHLAATMLEH